MIKETIIVMTVLGCGDQIDSCDYINTPNKTWTSIEACNNSIPSAILATKDAAYPVITTNCSKKYTADKNTKTANSITPKEEPFVPKTPSKFEVLQAKAEATDINLGGKINTYMTQTNNAIQDTVSKVINFVRPEK